MQMWRWQARWDGALIEVKVRAIPFSGVETALGLYPTAEVLIDGVTVAQRAGDADEGLLLQAALEGTDGVPAPVRVRVNCARDGAGCEIRVADEVLEVC